MCLGLIYTTDWGSKFLPFLIWAWLSWQMPAGGCWSVGLGPWGSSFVYQSLIFHSLVAGQLLLSLKDPVAVLFCGPGGSLHTAIHQSIREQPPRPLLCGVSHALVHGWALPLHPTWGLRGLVGDPLHPLQHRLVPEAQDHQAGEVPSVGGHRGDCHHRHCCLPQPLHTPQHKRAHFRALQWLRGPWVLPAVWLHQRPQHDAARGWHPRPASRGWGLHGHLAAGPGVDLQDHHYHIHLWHEGQWRGGKVPVVGGNPVLLKMGPQNPIMPGERGSWALLNGLRCRPLDILSTNKKTTLLINSKPME